MDRLIDADELKELFNKQIESGATDLFDAFDDALQDAQTVDAVPVVRCKDCKFSRELVKLEKKIYLDNCRACGCPEASQDGYMIVFPEHFCRYGERKDNGET